MGMRMDGKARRAVEAPTLVLAAVTYGLWAAGVTLLAEASLWLAVPVTAWAIAQHSSLTHEAIHGHPFRDARGNAALVWPALALVVPYARFRDQHLAHHRTPALTDPYDDPESNYLEPAVWAGLPRPVRWLLVANNTLAGRVILGPAVGLAAYLRDEVRAARGGDRGVLRGWALHLPAAAAVLGLVALSPMPLWAYLVAAYLGLSLLKIRTFLEHQAHETVRGRCVIVEDHGPLALLYLNNNLHLVHHMHPSLPWYRLPAAYRANPGRYLGRNGSYRYRSYGEVFRRHLWRPKDPVPHPLWQGRAKSAQ